ncbi:sensor histidine kinase [Planomonospora venezuelensis]|uniref:histidine kinase n=1 Tax=Planomonospora venezuelensis TaxID=1999 RepID=A0A841D996_PLAVE|nr:HAMP domain-containing sensor histidine kinase [Planomonospora venezuelensis]MBB5964705.1 signal transduction histidine kinase [Planomonospora venezuelensis]GIN03112.1 hypothetical protein Pve01_47700 [Planomonospora venezuelensis]
MAWRRLLIGEGPHVAARQIAVLLAGCALLALAVLPVIPEGHRMLLACEGGAQAVLAAAGWWLPWQRWPPWAPLGLGLGQLAVLGINGWVFGVTSTGNIPFFLLLVVWAGVNFPVRTVAAVVAVVAVTFLAPLSATEHAPAVLNGALVFVPTLAITGVLLAHQSERRRRDLDAIRRAHEALQRSHEEVRRAERWRAALTATLAHDVRSPLTGVQFALETLREDDGLSEEQREKIAAAGMRQADRIRRLAGGLLDADRVDTRGELRLNTRPVPVHDAAREALSYLACPVAVEIDGDPVVDADPERLEQILINLTTNAVRHGEPPVVVGAEPARGGMVAIHVRDHGPGVPESRRELLFSRFSSADTAPGSVGLGLWITRELARAHGGDVTYSQADPGARFTVVLPAADHRPGERPPS